jgi:nitroimidazol reductase NimA-like FMN-containing flavoprotein (pyridoxamine 5'-phosphate oxidase superfamily)
MKSHSSACPFHMLLNKEAGRPMRRITKKTHDEKRVERLLRTARVGYLGLVDEEGTYVVPLNYIWHQGSIYFHGSDSGRKTDALCAATGPLCFTIAEEHGTKVSTIPAETGTSYTSVMLFGVIEQVSDLTEATHALDAMLSKYVSGYFSSPLVEAHVEKYRSGMGSKTVVYRLVPDKITAKHDPSNLEELFYAGRTQQDDLKKS